MNKGITVLILGVVLGAMLLIMLNKPSPGGKISPGATASNVTKPETAAAPPAVAPSAPVTPPPAQAAGQNSGQAVAQAPAQSVPPAVTPTTPPQTPPPSLPKVEPPVSTAAPGNGKQLAAQPQGQGAGFFSIPPAPPSSKKPEKAQSGTPAQGQLDKRTEVPLKGGAAAPANGKKPEVKPASKPETKPEPKADPKKQAQESKAALAAAAKGPHTAKSATLSFAGQSMVLRVEAEEPFVAKLFVLPGPDRLVLDLMGDWKNLQAPKVPSNNVVKGSRVGRQPESARLVLDLNQAPKKYEKVQISPTVVEVRIQ